MRKDKELIQPVGELWEDKFGGEVWFKSLSEPFDDPTAQMRIKTPWGDTEYIYLDNDTDFYKVYYNDGDEYYRVELSLFVGMESTAVQAYVYYDTEGTLVCSSSPTGAEIWINNKNYGNTNTTLEEIDPGILTVIFKKEGYEDCEKDVSVTAGEQSTIHCTLTAIPKVGYIRCQAYDSISNAALNTNVLITPPGASLAELTPTTTQGLTPGNYDLEFSLEGYVTAHDSVTVKAGETVNAHGSMIKEAPPVVPGFDINVNIPGLLPGRMLHLTHVTKIPYTDKWVPDPLSIPADIIEWREISNGLYKARQLNNDCNPTPTMFQGTPMSIGDHYVIEVTDPLDLVYYYVEQDILQVTDTTTDITITKQTLPSEWMLKLCGWFDVSAEDCITSFINTIPDVLFSAEDLSIILEGKSIYPPYEEKTPTGWNYAFVALTFIPGSGAIKGASKSGVKIVKSAKQYPDKVLDLISMGRWPSIRFPGYDLTFLETMWDLQGTHLDEVIAKLEVGDTEAASMLITKYLPDGSLPSLCVKNLGTFTKELFDRLPEEMPALLIKKAGLESSFKYVAGKAIYNKTPITSETKSIIDEIYTKLPSAKEAMVNDADNLLKSTDATSESIGRVVNAADNYPSIIEDLGSKTPLADVDTLIENAVSKVTYKLTPNLTKTLFSRSLRNTLKSPTPTKFTVLETDAIKNIIWRDTPGFIEAMSSFDTAFKTRFTNSLALSGNEGVDVAHRAEGVLDASRYGDVFSEFGYDIQQVASAFSDYYLTMPEYWTKLGIDSIELAGSGRTLDNTPPYLTRYLAEAAESKLGREVAEELVHRNLIKDSVTQILAKGTITSDEIASLRDLYAKYPISADNALKEIDPTELANIINLLNKTKEGRLVSGLWNIRTALADLVELDVADEALEFWIKQHNQIPVGASKIKNFISQYKYWLATGVIAPAITIPLYYLIFEGSMTKRLGYEYGYLPTPIWTRLDSNQALTFRVIDILKRDPSNTEGIRLAKEVIAEYNYLINYVIENPIPEDPSALEQLNTFAGTGVGSLNEATLEFWELEREAFIVQIEVLTGLTLVEKYLPEEIKAKVKKIIDGDTVIIEYADVEYNVRFLGCNTPESKTYDNYSCIPGDHPFLVRRLAMVGGACGDEEIWNTDQQNYDESVVWLGKKENLEGRSTATFKSDLDDQFDGYDRFLGLPFNEAGENISLKSLKEGQSAVFFYKQNKQINPTDYLNAEKVAKDAKLGIWQDKFQSEKGWIKFESDPTATEVYLDGKLIGKTVSNVLLWETFVGTHTYEFKKVGYIGCKGTTSKITTAHTESDPYIKSCTLSLVEPLCPNPNASFTQSTTSPDVYEVVTFDATGSSPGGDQSIKSYNWDFKDDSTETGRVTSHVFTTPGTYIVELKVRNNCGESDTDTQIITVSATVDTGELTVKAYSEPNVPISGVTVYVDGIDKGNAPVTIKNLTVGTHQVRLEKSGYLSCTHCEGVGCIPGNNISPCDFSVEITKDTTKVIEVTMQKMFEIEVTSVPAGATILVDGKPITTNINRIDGMNIIEQILAEQRMRSKTDSS